MHPNKLTWDFSILINAGFIGYCRAYAMQGATRQTRSQVLSIVFVGPFNAPYMHNSLCNLWS